MACSFQVPQDRYLVLAYSFSLILSSLFRNVKAGELTSRTSCGRSCDAVVLHNKIPWVEAARLNSRGR